MNDVVINKVGGGLGRREPSTDAISGLIFNAVAVVGGLQLDTVYKLASLKEAEDLLLLDDAYDEANAILVYEHIREFFRVNPNGELYVKGVAQATTYANMITDETESLIAASNGAVNQIAYAYNPTVPVTDATDLLAAIPAAQTLAETLYNQHTPVVILLEGKGFDPATPNDFRALNSDNVSVFVGQAYAVANKTVSASTPYAKYAAIGTYLGAVSLARVNENVGWVQKFNLLGGTLQSASINNVPLVDIPLSQLQTSNTNGANFFRTHIGLAGIYINDAHTATAITSDFAYVENQRTINKATRVIRQTLLPDLNSPINVDPTTGRLSGEVVGALEAKGSKAITETMLNNAELSGFTFRIDPNQNILSTSELVAQLELVPTGTARKIVVNIGFINPFNS